MKHTMEGTMDIPGIVALTSVAPCVLFAFWLWGLIDKRIFNYYLTAYKPVPIPRNPKYHPRDVSVIVCTVDTLLPSCLRRWLENDPLEIIIVTTQEHLPVIRKIVRSVRLPEHEQQKVLILMSLEKGKRAQLRCGIEAASGRIIASVDDHITWHPEFLKHMLPCFEDPSVGACGGLVNTSIPEGRRDEKVITPWEVAATRIAYKRSPGLKSMYAAARWCTVLAGAVCLFRAGIVKDPDFLHAYLNDYWRGKHKLDVGEDTFVTRWLQSHNWTIAIQATPETEVWRTMKKNKDFLTQMFRWERSTIQTHIRTVLGVPQIWGDPYVARKTLERLFRPVITTIHLFAWIFSAYTEPAFTFVLLAYYLFKLYFDHSAFFVDHPYMRRYWWAAVGVDFFYIIQDYWCWATLNNTTWESRKALVEEPLVCS